MSNGQQTGYWERPRTVFFNFAILLILIVGANVALFWLRDPTSRVIVWLVTLLSMILMIMTIGCGVNGRPAGIIIDNRNQMSLSKLQMLAWTVLVVSALVTSSAVNLFDLYGSIHIRALAIDIPNELLIAMGIAAVSLTATPVILGTKTDQAPPPGAVDDAARKLKIFPELVKPDGKVFGLEVPSYASWLDLFRGDEVSNAASPDLSKIQQFLITLLLLAIYGGGVWSMFVSQASYQTLPALDEKFIWLMGISHASYLTYKAVPHSKP